MPAIPRLLLDQLEPNLDFYGAMVRDGGFSRDALRVTWILIYQHMNGATGRCDPAIATLAEELGLDDANVRRAIRELETSGWWIVGRNEGMAGRGGRTNTYRPNTAIAYSHAMRK
jgi:hypothetical protein